MQVNENVKKISETIINVIEELKLTEEVIEQINPDDNLITTYGLNSTAFISIIIKVESEFGIQIDDEDLNADNFSSINNLNSMLEARYLETA